MLNQALADQFRTVHQQGRTGALVVQQGDHQYRFYFDSGDLLLLDYGIDKELLLLRQYRAYHKIGFEIEAMVEQRLRAGDRIKTKDYLLQQQLVSQDEIEQVTRTLVEDTLCEVFGNPADRTFWDEGAEMESFDLDRSAVKLRIQVPLLLTMVEGRVYERDAVRREVPDYNVRFALVEGAPSPERLNDMERGALHFIDGRKSVEDIAVGIRDSSLNTACYLVSLQNQGFIEPSRAGATATGGVSGRTETLASASGRRGAVQARESGAQVAAVEEEEPQAPVADMGPPPGTPPMADPEVVIRSEEPRGSRAPMMLLLTVVLLLMVWIGYLVVQAQKRQQVIDELRDNIHAAIRSGDWAAAEVSLDQAREQAGNDSVLQGKLDELVEAENRSFEQRIEEISSSLEAEDITAAERQLASLPPDPYAYGDLWQERNADRLSQLRVTLQESQREFEEQARQFRRRVESLLDGGSVDVAMEDIRSAHPLLQRAGEQVLQDWRVDLLTEAADGTRPIGERERLLAQVEKADPSEDNRKAMRQVQDDIDRTRAVVEAAIGAMRQRLAAGDFQTVIAKASENAMLAAGSELAGTISALRQQAVELRDQLQRLIDEATILVRTSRDPAELAELASKLASRLEEMPEAANRAELERANEIVTAVVDSLTRETTEQEIAALAVIAIADPSEDEAAIALTPIEEALVQRQSELATREERAMRDIERAREIFARGSLDEAETAFQTILEREDYRRTQAHALARDGLEQVRSERVRREARFGALHQAMLADNVDAVTRLSREMALPRLPVLVRSLPAGAEIRVGGEVVGTTPFIIKDLSADRVDRSLTLALPGYETVEVDPAEAAGGWRIHVDLVRAPVRSLDLETTVTSEPAVIGGELWLVGKRRVIQIGPETVTRHGLDGSGGIGRSLVEPVYAPVCRLHDAIYVTTRDRIALRIEDGQVERLPLAAETNLALASYVSPLVLDREVLVVASLDHRLAASDTLESPQLWFSDPGAPFACSPLIVGDGAMGLRRDGKGLVIACDTGSLIDTVDLGEAVIAAWREDEAIVGYTTNRRLRWTGGAKPELGDPLEETVIAAAPGVVITAARQVNLVAEDGSWTPVGRIPANRQLSAPPVRWGDHVAITSPGEVVVLGSRGFSFKPGGDVLRPAVVGTRLAVVTVAGKVRFYEP